jgi:hypothetical protein
VTNDFGRLYGQADTSSNLYPEGMYDAVVESCVFGKSKDGSKDQWTVKYRTTSGENPGRMAITKDITVSEDSPRALGIMFRHLGALGVPVPDPANPQLVLNGTAPFWVLGWTEEQIAQAMTGRVCQIRLIHDTWDGTVRNKVADVRPGRPGAPTDWPRQPQNGAAPPAGFGQAPPQQPYAQPGPYGAQPGQGFPGQAVPAGYPQQPQQPAYGQPAQAPQPWQNVAGQQAPPPQQAPEQPWQSPGAQPWAQANPQAPQQQAPPPPQPPWAQPAPAQQPQQGQQQPWAPQQGQQAPPQPQAPGAPQQPPWAQQGPPQGQPPAGYPQQPGQQAPPPPAQAPGEAPPQPPWAQ